MVNTNRVLGPAAELAQSTSDAYSFNYYGAKNWLACVEMLFARDYNSIEVEGIMRSVFTRYAYDGRERARAKGTAADLARLMDEQSGGPMQLRDYIDDIVAETMQPEPVKLNSRDALRLVKS